MQFSALGLIEPLLRSLTSEEYSVATPIQAQAIPLILEGRDVLGSAQTGTGKTAAFALPILQRLAATPAKTRASRCVVLCPTRELALQIDESFRTYGRHVPHKRALIFGGVSQHPQVDALRRGVDVIIATPGRLLDLMDQGHVDLRGIEVLVLDEADRMLDMGFINDIRKIVAHMPKQRQTLLFSATMPDEIRKLAEALLNKPARVQVAQVSTPVSAIDQSVYFVERKNKPTLLAHLYHALPMARTIVFTRTKHGADRVVRQLHKAGIRSEAIHGNKSQNARQRAISNFRDAKTPILVATDIASRGIDIDGITHVVNYDLTHEPETYVHRIGRTARAGASGASVSFCDVDERGNLKAIESLIRHSIRVVKEHPTYPTAAELAKAREGEPRREERHAPRGGHQSRRDEPRHDRQDRHQPARHDQRQDRGQQSHGHRSSGEGSRPPQKTFVPQKAHGSPKPHAAKPAHAHTGPATHHPKHAPRPASATGQHRGQHPFAGRHKPAAARSRSYR